jgi:hypothetical protein
LRTFLASLPSGWWIGPSIGLIGILIGYILNRRSRIGPRLVYQQQALRLLGSASPILPEEVEIYFKNQKVPLIARSRVVLWNSGTQTIRSADIVSDDPIRVVVSQESQVLQARVIASTRPVVKFHVRLQPCVSNSVVCEFDFLDPDDGAIIEILHTDEANYPNILGTIRGMPRGLRDWGGRVPYVEVFRMQIPHNVNVGLALLIYLFLAGPSFILLGSRPEWLTPFWQPDFITMLRVVGVLYGTTMIVMGIWLCWRLRHRLPKKLQIDASE